MSIGKTLGIEVAILLVLTTLSYRRGGLGIGPLAPRAATYWTGILDSSRAADWTHVGVAGGIPTYTFDCATVRPSGIIDWKPNTTYQAGRQISDSRGNLETVTVAGTSGKTEPLNTGSGATRPPGSWPIVAGDTTVDGSITWTMSSGNTPPGTDTGNITNAIIDCDGKVIANSVNGGIVHLTVGHYYFTSGITFNRNFLYPQTVANPPMTGAINKVLLKGQGPMQTYLHFPRVGKCSGDICVQAYAADFTIYAAGAGRPLSSYPGAGAAWLGTTALDVYNKGDTEIIAGPWQPSTSPEPEVGDLLFLDQNNDAVSICPATSPNPPYNCTVPGATEVGTTATIVTSQPHHYHVGQCVGIGDVPNKNSNTGANCVGYNTGCNPDKTTIPTCGLPDLPSWWKINAVGCIVSGSFVDQSLCGSNELIAFQFTAAVSGLAPNGGGQATTDTGGTWLSSVNGATMVNGAEATQSARVCPSGVNNANPACLPGEISIRSQFEAKAITAITLGGQGSCPAQAYKCYAIDPPLYSNNWRKSQRPGVWWSGKKDNGDGLEGFTYLTEHDPGAGGYGGIRFTNAYNGWVRNVRAININRNLVWNALSARITMQDNYIGGTTGGASTAYVFEDNAAADTLLVNNICQNTVSCLMTSTVMGRVAAYNFMMNSGYSLTTDHLMPMMTMNHLAAFYNMFEGNDSAGIQTDNFHGTGGVSTAFRSRIRGEDYPIKATNRNAVNSFSFNRGLNFVGNVMGTVGIQNRYSDDNPANASGATDRILFSLGQWKQGIAAFGVDRLATTTSLRWGNYDSVTGTTRWCGTGTEPNCTCGAAAVTPYYCRIESEIPTASFTFLASNAVPANHTLPASFFLPAVPAFWTTTWGTPGWPAIGPDVDATGSPLDTTCPITAGTGTGPGSNSRCDGIGHHAYQIPAQICYNNLPVDPQYQKTFVVRGASWFPTGGYLNRPYVSLQVNNTLNVAKPYSHTIEVTGINPAGYNGTFMVATATATTITYWLATNPGPYVSGGMISTPNYKQYDAHMCYPNEPL